jgi:predicted N-formylglutamate amidohydrolase
VLKTHRASDPGAFEVANQLHKLSGAPFVFTKISRLIVDMNRSPESPTALSRWTKSLSPKEQTRIFDALYLPYRELIYSKVTAALKSRSSADRPRLVHLGIHSFSPYIDPARRGCHIGILFDPKNEFESSFATRLRENLEILFPDLGVRLNFPYRGDADGLTTDLRKRHSPRSYAGIEIEFNQAFLRNLQKKKSISTFTRTFYVAVETTLTSF